MIGHTSLLVRAMRSRAVSTRGTRATFDVVCRLPKDGAGALHIRKYDESDSRRMAIVGPGSATAPDRTSQASSMSEDAVLLALIEKAREVFSIFLCAVR